MSISSEIQRISGKVSDSFDEVVTKGGTVTTRKIADLPDAIASIPTGTGGTIYGVNATHILGGTSTSGGKQVLDFSTVSGAVDMSPVQVINTNNILSYKFYNTKITSFDGSTIESISGTHACSSMFSGCTALTSADLGSLTTISGASTCYDMFNSCSNLTTLDLSSLTSISESYACQQMFQGCQSLTSANMGSLTSISSGSYICDSMFRNCYSLATINLRSLETISGSNACFYMFRDCRNLFIHETSAQNPFINLETISGYNACRGMFYNAGNMAAAGSWRVSFPNLTSVSGEGACYEMFNQANLYSINLSNLTNIENSSSQIVTTTGAFQSAFANTPNLNTAYIDGAATISANNAFKQAFSGSGVKYAYFAPTTITGLHVFAKAFEGCTQLNTVKFCQTGSADPAPAIALPQFDNPFEDMFNGCTQENIYVYAPNANKSYIEALSDYPKFGASAGTTVTWYWE